MPRYLVYDVFTDTPFGGNQLAVFPEAEKLPQDKLQKIAREFNFSETTFVYPPGNPAHTAKVRIFTPTMEVPFAGHPTIGTAVALHALGKPEQMVLELGVGPIAAAVTGNVARFTTARPLEILAEPTTELVAECLSLAIGDIRLHRHAPVQASLGLPFVLAELSDREALSSAKPVTDALRRGAMLYPGGLDFAIFCYTRAGSKVDARMFAPLDNIPEDPATGSAAAALAAFLAQEEGRDIILDIRQGEDMGRPSRISATTGAGGVTISGAAVQTMEGRLLL